MAPPPPPPPLAKCPTTVLDLDDDLLREVFLRLPALPSLVRAALACRTFLHAVRSSPAFRRTFRALHPSPFVGLFIQCHWEPEVPSFDAHHPCSDRDFAAAVRGGDFSLTGLLLPDGAGDNRDKDEENKEEDTNEEDESNEEEDNDEYEENNEEEDNEEYEEEKGEDDDDEEEEEEDDENSEEEDASPVWQIERCCDGYVVLRNRRAKQIAAYNPLTRALHLFPSPPYMIFSPSFEFHIISSQEDPGMPIRVVCFYSGGFQALVGVISSDSSTDEWKIFPETVSGFTGKVVNGSVYWTHTWKPYITVFNPATLQFTKMDLPPLLAEQKDRERAFVLGNTKDGRPCIVSPHLWGDCSLDVYFWRRDEHDDNGVEGWILDQTFPLKTIRQLIKFSEVDDEFIIMRLIEVIDGIVYLRTEYEGYTEAPRLLLSFCLETAELKKICEDYGKPVHPYIMAWPPSLVLHDKGLCSKDQALSTPSSEGSYVKAGGETTQPASVAKA